MSVSSESRPSEAVDSRGPPITNDSETTVVPQPTHDDQPSKLAKTHTATMVDTVLAQEARAAGAEAVVNIPAEDEPFSGVERVAGAVDDKAETCVEGSKSTESTLVPLKHTSLASEPPQVTESNPADSTPIASEEPREDTKEAAATASTTPSAIEVQEAVAAQDTKEEEKASDQQFESTKAESESCDTVTRFIPNASTQIGDATDETSIVALPPTREFTSAIEQTTGKPPVIPPLTIQLDAAKPVEGVILSESLDDLSINQADKANEEGPEIPIESEMTFASPVSPIVVARAVSIAGEESVPGTPVSETYSDAGTRESTPGPEDGDASRARTKAEKKRAKRWRQKQASKDAAAMKSELEAALIEVPAVPAPVEEAKEEPAPVEEKGSAPVVEEPVVGTSPVEEAPHAVKEEVAPTAEKDVKETKPDLFEIQVEETVAGPVTSSEDEAKVDAAATEPTQEETPKAELAVEDVRKAEAAVEEPVIEEAPKVEAVAEDTAPEVDVAPRVEPAVDEPVPSSKEESKGEIVVEEPVVVIEEGANVEEPAKLEAIEPEVGEPAKVEEIKPEAVEEPIKVEEVQVEDVPKAEEEPKFEEPAKVVEEEVKVEVSLIEEPEPVKVEEEAQEVEESVRVEGGALEEPVEVEEDAEVEEPVKAEEPVKVEEPAKVEEEANADAPVEEVLPAVEDTSKPEETVKIESFAVQEDDEVPVQEGIVAPEEPEEVGATIVEKNDTTEPTQKVVPVSIDSGLVEPVSTPAPLEDEKAVPEAPEPVEEETPVAEVIEPKIIVATTAEKLEIPTGLVEPIASPALDQGLVGENREPVVDKIDAALEDAKFEEVVEEIDEALEEVKEEEPVTVPAAVGVTEAELEGVPAIEEVKADEVEVTPAVDEAEVIELSNQEPAPTVEGVKVVDEPAVEPVVEELPATEENIQPEEPAATEDLKEEQLADPVAKAAAQALAVEASTEEPEPTTEQPVVEEVVVPVLVQEELIAAVEDVPVGSVPAERADSQGVEVPAEVDGAVVLEEVPAGGVEKAIEVPSEGQVTLEKSAEEIVDAVPELSQQPIEASQEPEQPAAPLAAHTATSTESTDSPIAPATPSVVVEDLEPVQEKEAFVPAIPQTLDRPKSPFSPSFSVTTVGGAVTEVEAPLTELGTEEAALAADSASELSVTPPARPWTPSYSVHSQGSPLQPKVALDDDVPAEPLSEEAPEQTKALVDAPVEVTNYLQIAVIEETAQPIPEAEILTKEAEVPAAAALPPVEETQAPEDNITAPVPLIAPIPLAGSSWVPSYSVSRQGSPLPKTPEPVEKSLPQDEPVAQVPVAAESFWNGVKAVEDGNVIQSAEIQVPQSGEQNSSTETAEAPDTNDSPAVLRDAPATEPTVAPAANSLAPPETPPRARLESNSSTSKLLPGGWFSPRKGSHDSRPSLETASGQFVPSQGFSSPIDSAPVLPPIATENLNVPSHEMGQNSASPSKKRWCTIM